MVIYSGDFKLMLVKEYLEGKLSYRRLAAKYDIPTTSLRGWVSIYRNFGENRLMKNGQHYNTYSFQFKLDVLSFMKRTGASVADTALQFGITSPSLISMWRKTYLEGNLKALNKSKGLPPMSKSKNQNKEMTREQELERENELLRLENEYLKKLRAFQMDPDGYLEKHKQRYHQNSKKSSN